jgi:hypothetical protein
MTPARIGNVILSSAMGPSLRRDDGIGHAQDLLMPISVPLQLQFPRLTHQVMPEAVMRYLFDQPVSRGFVDPQR